MLILIFSNRKQKMQNSLIKQKKAQTKDGIKQKSTNKKKTQANEDTLTSKSSMKIKVLPAKFIEYLNQLNSSIQRCKQKLQTKNHPYEQKRRRSVDSLDQNSVSSRKTCQSVDKKKIQRQQYVVQAGTRINGKLHGNVILRFCNGSVFRGEMEDGELKEGNIKYVDGIQYYGGFKNFLFHGLGKLKNKNGTAYVGIFQNGAIQKNAQILYENGDRYKGQIVNYKKHGDGELKMKNGNRFIGQFVQGQITGFGTYFVNQFPIAEGEWKNGEYLGKGALSQSGTYMNSNISHGC